MIKLVIYGTFYIENEPGASIPGGGGIAATMKRCLARAGQPARFRVHVRTKGDGAGQAVPTTNPRDIDLVVQERDIVRVSGVFPRNQLWQQELAVVRGVTAWDCIRWPFAASMSFLRRFLRTGFSIPTGDPLAVIALYADGRVENVLRGRVYAETSRTRRISQGDLLVPGHGSRALGATRHRQIDRLRL